jgi:hypothetical protein
MISSRRMGWAGNVARIEETRREETIREEKRR